MLKLVLGGGKDVRGRGGGDLGGLDQATSGLQSVIGLGDLECDCLVRGVEGEIGGELFAFGGELPALFGISAPNAANASSCARLRIAFRSGKSVTFLDIAPLKCYLKLPPPCGKCPRQFLPPGNFCLLPLRRNAKLIQTTKRVPIPARKRACAPP